MLRSIPKSRSLLHALLLSWFLIVYTIPCYGEVIFEDNFDSTADWNSNGQYEGNECSPLGVGAPSANICQSNTYPPNWDAYRSMPGTTGLHPVISIQRPPDNLDHTTGIGKSIVIWQESVSGVNFPGDGIVMKKLNQDYDEIYIQFWIKSNPNWQFASGEGYVKTIRAYHRGYTTGNWFDFFTQGQRPSPSWIIEPKWSDTYGWRHADALRGAPDDGSGAFDGVCVDPGSFNGRATCIYGTDRIEQPWDLNNPMLNWKTPGQLLDGEWHKMTVHLKMNTKTGTTWNNDGIYQLWLDNVQHVNATGLRWIAADNAVGWNGFAVGGNANNMFNASTPSDQWYTIDDIVVSTTPIPDNYVIGGGSADTTAPTISISSPSSSTTVSGIYSVITTASDNVGVTTVEFYVNGSLQGTTTVSPYNFSWNTASLANGSYTLIAKAYDAAGNVGQSSSVTVTLNNVVNTPPVAGNDSYSTNQDTALTVAAPGVLSNDSDPEGATLTAQLVSNPAHGTLTFNSNGSFIYTPTANYSGSDSFTYQASDGSLTSGNATVTLTITPTANILFSDDFTSPWTTSLGTWSVTNGALQGSSSAQEYAWTYIAPTPLWTNYSVEGLIQFPAGAFGGGIGGRLNPATGANYGAWVYPDGSAGGANTLQLVKSSNWTTWSGTPMATANLPSVGTGWHSLKQVFSGNRIQVYYDGTLMIDVTDDNFDSTPAYSSGGICVGMWTYLSPYVMRVDNIVVR